jgi:cysteine synthase A
MPLKVTESILELVGNTPLLHLRRVASEGIADVFAKLEYFTPGLSVKDRAALGMVLDAEERGALRPGSTLIEPTAGNTGIGLALVGSARGYRVVLVVPDGYSQEKMKVMRALGAELVLTPMAEGMQRAIEVAQEIARSTPGAFIPQQFSNPANPAFHYGTTGREIYEQMDGRIDAAVVGCGSAGTFTGVARYLRERIPDLACYVVESQGSVYGGGAPGPKRVEGIGSTFIPENFDRALCCEVITANDEVAYGMARRLAAEEGVLAGGSGGANVWAAIEVATRLGPGKRVVTIVPDIAERYLSKGIYDDLD